MSIFKDVKEDAVQNEELSAKDDLFTVVSEEEQDDVDLELLDSLMEDDSLVAPEEDEVPAEEVAEEATEPAEAEPAEAPLRSACSSAISVESCEICRSSSV